MSGEKRLTTDSDDSLPIRLQSTLQNARSLFRAIQVSRLLSAGLRNYWGPLAGFLGDCCNLELQVDNGSDPSHDNSIPICNACLCTFARYNLGPAGPLQPSRATRQALVSRSVRVSALVACRRRARNNRHDRQDDH